MSSHIVGVDSLNKILGHIRAEACETHHSYSVRVLAPLGYELTGASPAQEWERLGLDMLRLNAEAVQSRYPPTLGVEDMVSAQRYHYEFSGEKAGDVCLYKAIQCWAYQCCEGKVPLTPLYRAFEQIRDHVARRIVESLPAYTAAPWG